MQWQVSTDNTNFTDIGGATSATINTGALTQTTYYRVGVTAGCASYSSSIEIAIGGGSFPGGYVYRKKITFAGSDIAGSGTHTNFPMLVRLASDADLQAGVTSADGFDIVFTDSDGTTSLYHELEHYDNSNGALAAWVNVDLAPGVDKEIYMYYGNSAITTDQSSTSTWSSAFDGIWHLHDDFEDATTNNRDGTNSGSLDMAGIIGDAQDFEEGDDDYIDLDPFDVTTGVITLSAWVYLESYDGNDPRIISKADGGGTGDHYWKLGLRSGTGLFRSRFDVSTDGTEETTSVAVPTGSWQYMQAVSNGTRVIHYLNGIEVGDEAHAGALETNAAVRVRIGNDSHNLGNSFDGLLDEVRVINVVRSEEWLLTEYNNQRDGSTSLTFGPEETGGCDVATGTLSTLDDNIASGESTVITLAGYDPGSTFQWQASDDDVTFTNIPSAIVDTLATGALTTSKFYRVQVTSCETAPSASILISVGGDYLAGYSFRRKLIFRGSEIVGSHTDFPLLVRFDADSELATQVQNANGYDIVFTEADGTTLLSHDLDAFDSATGQLAAWVKANLTNATNKEIYMYYGNAAISADQSNTNTWDNFYEGVFHLNGTNAADASASVADGSESGTDAYESPNISNGRNFQDQADLVTTSVTTTLTDDVTVSAWVRWDNINHGHDWPLVYQKENESKLIIYRGGGARDRRLRYESSAKIGTDESYSNTQLTAGEWYYVVITFDQSNTSEPTFYVNGMDDGLYQTSNFTTTAAISDASGYVIGNRSNAQRGLGGQIEEFRISNVQRSANWILTEYYNQRDGSTMMYVDDSEWTCDLTPTGTVTSSLSTLEPGETTELLLSDHNLTATLDWESSTDGTTFSSMGESDAAITSPALTENTYFRVKLNNGTCDAYSDTLLVPMRYDFIDGYSYRMKLTIPAANVSGSGNLIDFPLLIDIASDSIRSEANGGHVYNDNGYEFRFTMLDGTTLDYERENYDEVNGQLRAWVKLPLLSGSTDTEIFMYYGNCSAMADPNTAATWASDYAGVWHFSEDPTGTILDATGNDNDGTDDSGTGNVGQQTGKIGPAYEFDKANSQRIEVPNDASLQLTSSMTLSAWVRPYTTFTGFYGVVDKTDAYKLYLDESGGDYQVGFRVYNGGNVSGASNTTTLNFNSDWYHIAAVYDDPNDVVRFYLNGAALGTNGWTTNPANTTDPLGFGAEGTNDFFDGLIDEIRIQSVVRSADWIATEFDNQNSPATFITVGTEEIEFQWTGTTSTTWATTTNWSSCEVPGNETPVRISGGATFDPLLSGNVTLCDITVESGATMNLGSSNTTVCGNIVNEGAIAGGTSTMTFSGNDNQTYSATVTATATLNDVVINKSGGAEIQLFDNLDMDGALTLNTGFINLTGGSLDLSDGTLVGGGPDAFVVTGGSSCLRQTVANAEVLFAVGVTSDSYTPAVLNNSGTEDIFCIRVIDDVFPDGSETGTALSEGVVGKTWFIDEDVDGGSNVVLTLQWRNADQKNSFSRDAATITHFNTTNSKWELMSSGTVASVGSGRFGVSATGITDFSPFGVGQGDIFLPIELLAFDAQWISNHVLLTWSTASEKNNDYFSIQRGIDGKIFETIANVPGQGDSEKTIHHEYVDDRPLPGSSFYRLKQTDFDGAFTFSPIIQVVDGVARTAEMSIYPNANDGVNFQWSLFGLIPHSQVMIQLYDLQGNLLQVQPIQLDGSGSFVGEGFERVHLNPGMYLLKATNDGKEMVSRLIVR
ncbi:MAG: DUF2341 domain-containing protein [Bacteroidota bacterium]